MKNRIKILLAASLFFIGNLSAQTIYSNGTGGGDWGSSSTWLGGVVPNVNNDVIISGGDSVSTTIGVECNTLTIYTDGKLATSIDSIHVAGTLELEADAYFYNQSSHSTLPGTDYILDAQSYVVHSGSGTVGGESNYEFGNLVIQRTAGCVPGADLIIHGNLIINNSAANVVLRGVRPNTGSQTHLVEGDLYIYQGTLACIDATDNSFVGIWNILGNAYIIDNSEPYQDARIGLFSSSNAAGLGIINIGGDLIVQGGRVQGGTSTSPGLGNGIFNLGGNFLLDINSRVSTNTLGYVAFNFVGNGPQNVNLDNKFQMETNIYDTIAASSQVVFDLDTNKWGSSTGGEFIVNGSLEMVENSFLDGPGSFMLNPGGTLKIGSPDGISLTDPTGNIRVSGSRTYSESGSYEYKGTASQLLGDGLPSTVSGFAVNNPVPVILDRGLTVNQSLKVLNGSLDLNNNIITLGSNALLSETPGHTVQGMQGKIVITKDAGTPSGLNVGGLGAVLTSSSNLGSTTVERTHAPGTGQGNQGIKRMYHIMPSNNSGLNATLRFYYDESELNGIPEGELTFFKSLDGTNNSWAPKGGSINTTENYAEVSGLDDFSFWTLAGINTSLPVEETVETEIPQQFALLQNYPNPFNPATTIVYDVPVQSRIVIKVFDIIGNETAVLIDEVKNAGRYHITFDGSRLPSGIYFYRIISDKFNSVKSMILLK